MSKIVAKSARWENGAWLFSNCIVYKLDKNGELTGRPQVYPKKTMAIRETPRDFYRGQFESQVMNYSQLSEYVKKFYKVDKKIARRLAVDLYYKTSFPFTSFVVVLLGIGFGLHTRRGGALWGLGTSVGISFVYYGIVAICLAAGKGGWLPPAMAAWLGNILFLGIGFVLLLRHSL
jgi:lipopolysaccharide export system permease protein